MPGEQELRFQWHAVAVCAAWLVVDALFEFVQHSSAAPALAALTPPWFQGIPRLFEGIPVLENTESCFLRSMFDPIDILFAAAGALAAYLTIKRVQAEQRSGCVS